MREFNRGPRGGGDETVMASEGEGDNTVAAVVHVTAVAHVATVAAMAAMTQVVTVAAVLAMAQVAAGNGVGHRGLLRVGVRIC